MFVASSDPPAWKRLIDPGLSANERLDLINSIFSDHDELEVFEYLSGDDAQAFVDVIDEASVRVLPPPSNFSQTFISGRLGFGQPG